MISSLGFNSEQMNAELLERDWENYVYGAVTFREADSASGIFDYTVHVSRCPPELGGRSTFKRRRARSLCKCIARHTKPCTTLDILSRFASRPRGDIFL